MVIQTTLSEMSFGWNRH